MKFLILLKLRGGTAPLDPKVEIGVWDAAKAWTKGKLADGTLDCAYNVLPNDRGYFGVGIGNAPSLEALFELLTTYPPYLFIDFEVYPLSDVNQAIDNVTAVFKKMMGG